MFIQSLIKRFNSFSRAGKLFIVWSILLTSCSPIRHLGEDEYLLRKNEIITSGEKISKNDFTPLLRQKPNKKILMFIRFHLGAHTFGSRLKKDSWLKRFLTTTVGEPPVILDSLITQRSAAQIELYLNSKGFFNSEVSYEVKPNGPAFSSPKKVKVVYKAIVAKPYVLRDVSYEIEDKTIGLIINATAQNSLLVKGRNYDEDLLSEERDRLTNLIRSKGYYYFSKDNILFRVDTNLHARQYDLVVSIPNLNYRSTSTSDSLQKNDFKAYTIHKVYFVPDKPGTASLVYDTIWSKESPQDYYVFIYEEGFTYKSKTLERFIFVRPGKLYNIHDVSQTFIALSRLNNFRYNNVVFIEPDSSTGKRANQSKELDCYVTYTRSDRRGFSAETELRNTFGSLGLAGKISYTNKNVFRGVEIFRLSTNGAMEVQQTSNLESAPGGFLPFNTYEAGLNASLDFPRFLIPISQDRFPRYFKPKTTINTGYNYQKRPDYTRYVANATFGYDWQESQFKRHLINLYEINSVKIFPTDEFLMRIKPLDPVIKNAYSDHMITLSRYTFFYTNQVINKPRDFIYFRFNMEVAGSTAYLISSALKGKVPEDEGYKIFNIRFAQYLRSDIDFRTYRHLNANNILAFRTAIGYAHPFGNSQYLPFEKSYFAGGANGVRAWNIRSLGPGGFDDSNNPSIDKIGDIAFESSIEYRFPVYKMFKSALFIDAGNVWLEKGNQGFPLGNFQFNRFYKEIALGAGIGLRLDFSFFVIRGDFAVPVRDPERAENDRWVIRKAQPRDFRFNLGIGYPF